MSSPKQFHDVVGSYNRFDVFDLKVNRKRLTPISFVEKGSPNEGGDSIGREGLTSLSRCDAVKSFNALPVRYIYF